MNFSARSLAGVCSWWPIRWVLLLLLFACLQGRSAYGGEMESRRIWAGVDLFPSLLAADLDIEGKCTPDGMLLLVLLYVDEKRAAEDMARHLLEINKIRGIPIRVEVSDDITLKKYSDYPPAGVFLTQRITQDLDPIIEFGKRHHILVFSPFEDDVKEGIPGGIIIRDRILPYVNITTLRSSEIRIKEFFLRISKQYDP